VFKTIASKISESVIQSGMLPEEDQDICEYGLQQLFTILLNVFTAIWIGYLFGLVLESIVALVVFIPLRTYAGGFHFNNPILCYVASSLTVCMQMMFVKYTHLQYSMILASILLVILIANLAPVASENKPLSKKETIKYKKTTQLILMIIESTLLTLLFYQNFLLGRSILSSLILSFVLLTRAKTIKGLF
jgi:accessory gene regulator B